jgi:hypothetical protein
LGIFSKQSSRPSPGELTSFSLSPLRLTFPSSPATTPLSASQHTTNTSPHFPFLLNQLAKTKRGQSHTPSLFPLVGRFSFFSITDRHLLQQINSNPSPATVPIDPWSPSSAVGAISSFPSDRTTTHISTAASAATDDSNHQICHRQKKNKQRRKKAEKLDISKKIKLK